MTELSFKFTAPIREAPPLRGKKKTKTNTDAFRSKGFKLFQINLTFKHFSWLRMHMSMCLSAFVSFFFKAGFVFRTWRIQKKSFLTLQKYKLYVKVIFFQSKTLQNFYFKTFLNPPIGLNLHSGVSMFRCLSLNPSKTLQKKKLKKMLAKKLTV